MKARKANCIKRLLALLAVVGSLAATGAVFASEGIGLGITPELTARWWQWAFSIPSSVHPLTFKETDPTGSGYCMVGQEGEAWYLGGIFKVIDVAAARKKAQFKGNGEIVPVEIERECTIPLGKTLLIPVLNAECNTAEEIALGSDVPSDLFEKTRYLRNCAKSLADAVDKESAAAYFGPVDSGGAWSQDPVTVRRTHTVLPFSITYSPDNILSSNCGGIPDDDFLCAPNPNPSLAQVDGYWAQVRPPKAGTYKLQTFGEAPAFNFALRVTYILKVVGPQEQ